MTNVSIILLNDVVPAKNLRFCELDGKERRFEPLLMLSLTSEKTMD